MISIRINPFSHTKIVTSQKPFEIAITGEFTGTEILLLKSGEWIFTEEIDWQGETPRFIFDSDLFWPDMFWKIVARKVQRPH